MGLAAVYATKDLSASMALAIVIAAVLVSRLTYWGFEQLRGERRSLRSRESAGELGQDRQVSMEGDPLQPPDAKRQ